MARLRAGQIEPDEELYLARLAALSEAEHEGWAETRWVPSSQLFSDLGWEWSRSRSLAIGRTLDRGMFAKIRPVDDTVRLRLAGVVRVRDEVGSALAEAREHVSVGRPRAAGCVAGVELERRLKALAIGYPSITIAGLGDVPTIATCNDALKTAGAYPKPTWRKIQHLGDLRNKCAHALDHEPTVAEARELVDGIETLLRELPSGRDAGMPE